MKKYLITGALTIVVGGLLTSCHETEIGSDTYIEQKLQTYEKVFKEEFGEINPNQDWGFGASSVAARTRALMTRAGESVTINHHDENAPNAPDQPTFRGKSAITRPTMPTAYYNTKAEVEGANLPLGKDVTSDGATSYINSDNPYITDKKNQVIYVIGDVTLEYSPGTGSIFVITQGSKLTLTNGLGTQISAYLASNATLDVSTEAEWGVRFSDHVGVYLNSGSKLIGTTLSFFDGCEVLNAGGTITATNLTVDKNSTLWNEGSITVSNKLEGANENAYIYNAAGKTITTKDLELINNEDFLYNDGTINASGNIRMTNNLSEMVNNGTLTGAKLDLSAGGNYYNTTDGITTIYGLTYINNNNAEGTSWMNDGVYSSGDFTVMNMDKVYNNCKLTVTGNSSQGYTGSGTFEIEHNGSFVLNGNASVKADNMIWGTDAEFYMKDNSMLWVVGQILSKKTNKGYGAHGLGSRYSIIKAGSIAYEDAAMCRMNYYGKIWVDTDNHFAQGFIDDQHDQPYYYYDTTNKTVMFKFLGDACPITSVIEAGKCHHGYGTTVTPDNSQIPIEQGEATKTGRKVTTYYYKYNLRDWGRIMCEDLGVIRASDIDFNDVVFDAYIYDAIPYKKSVTYDGNTIIEDSGWERDYNSSESRLTEIYVLAAGGTLPITVAGERVKNNFEYGPYYDSQLINTCTKEGNETGGSYSNPWQNTYTAKKIEKTGIDNLKDIKVVVQYGERILELNAEPGLAPHKICVPLDLNGGVNVKWPMERVEINTAYKDFTKYVRNESETIVFNADANSTVGGSDSNNSKGVSYYNLEKSKSCWTTGSIDTSKLYANTPTYTPRDVEQYYERTDKSKVEENVTISDTSKGYQNGETILVRRRN